MKLVSDYIDEIKLRLSRYQIAYTDDMLLLTYLNRARRQVQLITYKLMPERYGDIAVIEINTSNYQLHSEIRSNFASIPIRVYQLPLPNNLIDITTCIFYSQDRRDDSIFRAEARETTKEELFNSTRSSFSTPTIHNPIYTWERNHDPNLTFGDEVNPCFYKLLITGFDYYINSTQTSWLVNHIGNVELYYIYGLDELDLEDTDYNIPTIYEEVVIYYAMLYCLQVGDVKDSIKLEIQNMLGLIKENYETNILLPSQET
jgi:hypothetical protein